MRRPQPPAYSCGVAEFHLSHCHAPTECRTAYASWRGFESPLRKQETISSCALGGHRIYWTVEAGNPEEAHAQLPPFLAERTEVNEVTAVAIP